MTNIYNAIMQYIRILLPRYNISNQWLVDVVIFQADRLACLITWAYITWYFAFAIKQAIDRPKDFCFISTVALTNLLFKPLNSVGPKCFTWLPQQVSKQSKPLPWNRSLNIQVFKLGEKLSACQMIANPFAIFYCPA